jgi:hypothetical protein
MPKPQANDEILLDVKVSIHLKLTKQMLVKASKALIRHLVPPLISLGMNLGGYVDQTPPPQLPPPIEHQDQ